MENKASVPITRRWYAGSSPILATLALDSCEFVSIRGFSLHRYGLNNVVATEDAKSRPLFLHFLHDRPAKCSRATKNLGHEKHENLTAGLALKSPLGAREIFAGMTKGFLRFLWPKSLPLGFGCLLSWPAWIAPCGDWTNGYGLF